MKDLGLMHYFLGMEVHQNSDEIFVYQTKYAKDMLKKFGMDGCKHVSIPIAHGELLCKQESVALSSTETEYIALTSVGAQAFWLRKMSFEFKFPTKIGAGAFIQNDLLDII